MLHRCATPFGAGSAATRDLGHRPALVTPPCEPLRPATRRGSRRRAVRRRSRSPAPPAALRRAPPGCPSRRPGHATAAAVRSSAHALGAGCRPAPSRRTGSVIDAGIGVETAHTPHHQRPQIGRQRPQRQPQRDQQRGDHQRAGIAGAVGQRAADLLRHALHRRPEAEGRADRRQAQVAVSIGPMYGASEMRAPSLKAEIATTQATGASRAAVQPAAVEDRAVLGHHGFPRRARRLRWRVRPARQGQFSSATRDHPDNPTTSGDGAKASLPAGDTPPQAACAWQQATPGGRVILRDESNRRNTR